METVHLPHTCLVACNSFLFHRLAIPCDSSGDTKLCDVIYINHSVSDEPVCLKRPTKINFRTGKVVKVSIGTRREWIKNEETVMRNYSKLIRRSPIGFSGSGISII